MNELPKIVMLDDPDSKDDTETLLKELSLWSERYCTVDVEAVLDIIYGGLNETHLGIEALSLWLVQETLDTKSVRSANSVEHLRAVITQYFRNTERRMKQYGLYENGHIPYAFQRLLPFSVVVLYRGVPDPGFGRVRGTY